MKKYNYLQTTKKGFIFKKLFKNISTLALVVSILYVSWKITAILFIPFVLILALIGAKELLLKIIGRGR